MDPREYEIVYRAEDSHWWYTGMAAITKAVIRKHCAGRKDLRILDAGCGTGGTLSWLAAYGKAYGLDLSGQAARFARIRGHRRLVMASVMAIPFADASFDLVTSLDVIYFHEVDDEAALKEFRRVLVPGGRLVLRTPAYNWLRGVHDVKVSTRHRYTRGELREKMARNGLRPVFLSYANTLLFPAALMKRLFERWLPPQTDSDVSLDLKGLDRYLRGCLHLESLILPRCPFPFGLSVVAVGEKPSR